MNSSLKSVSAPRVTTIPVGSVAADDFSMITAPASNVGAVIAADNSVIVPVPAGGDTTYFTDFGFSADFIAALKRAFGQGFTHVQVA